VSFAAPAWLAALALVPLALGAYLWQRRRARRYAVRFPGVPTLAAIVAPPSRWRRLLPVALFLAALTALTTAMAKPQTTVDVAREQASIILVTDVSRSMLAEDVEPSRLDAARAAARRFLDQVPDGAKIGAVAFSEEPHTQQPPTDDRDDIRSTIDALDADGGTATGDGLAAALAMVDGRGEKRAPAAIVMLSDGEATTGRDPIEVAREARRLRVPVYTVALGTSEGVIQTPGGSFLPVPPDPETMREIAEVSGGRAFEVEEADELDAVYEDLGSRVATEKEKREITALFAGGGIVLLLGAAAFGLRTTARLP
jgi:Ca-activated chloride channel homolog